MPLPAGMVITMEKNRFLFYNDIVSVLYSCKSIKDLQTLFLPRLTFLAQYSYASIFLWDPKLEQDSGRMIPLTEPVCVPEYFTEAEKKWVQYREEDDMLWLKDGAESMLVRESDMIPDEQRLNSELYKHCYRKYNVYDTLEYAIVDSGQPLGFLTLFRTKADEPFCDDDIFIIRSLGIHLKAVFHRIVFPEQYSESELLTYREQLMKTLGLTAREIEILDMVLHFRENRQIADQLGIKENTLQKHYYNIFRKLDVSSRWEAASWYYSGEWKKNL